MRCPECGRELEPKPKGPFKILCWPRHKLAAYGKLKLAEQQENYRRNPNRTGALEDNELDCPNSGQPVE